MSIEWRPIPGFLGYEASNAGEVRGVDRYVRRGSGQSFVPGRTLRQFFNKGRVDVFIQVAGKQRRLGVGRAVLLAFIGPCPDDMECCHNDGDPTNNSAANLRWDTHSENVIDCLRHGTHPKASQTECVRGHALDGANLIVRRDYKGRTRRDCRECKNSLRRERRAAAGGSAA